MKYRGFFFKVETYPIIPPLPQGDCFGGKVISMDSRNRRPAPFPGVGSELWGKTEAEAYSRAVESAKKWIDQQFTDKAS